jgi:phycocyanobilin lyase subunit beta
MSDIPIEKLIQAVKEANTAADLTKAVVKLSQARHNAAIPTLITVLGYNNPGAAVAAVEGLIALGEAAIPDLLAQIDGYNYGARAWAIRACASIGDPRSLDLLLKAASSDFALSVRRAAAKGLGFINWSKLSETEVKSKQLEALETLLQVTADPEWVVRYGAVVGLESLTKTLFDHQINLVEKSLVKLREIGKNDLEISVAARSQMAVKRIESLVF